MAEHSAVNRRVVGSSPTCGAKNIEENKRRGCRNRQPFPVCAVFCAKRLDQLIISPVACDEGCFKKVGSNAAAAAFNACRLIWLYVFIICGLTCPTCAIMVCSGNP